MGGVEHAGGLTFVGHVWHFSPNVYCMDLSCEMLCGASVLSACSTCHGSFIPTRFVLSARSDPFILRVAFAVMRP